VRGKPTPGKDIITGAAVGVESSVCPTAAPFVISLSGVGLSLTTKRYPGR
jgi:hypothetical protein